MLNLPVYLRNQTYYLHTRIFGKQVKKSLHTADKSVAMMRALDLLKALMKIDLSNIRKYEIDLEKGILKADDSEDHKRMLEALSLLKQSQRQPQNHPLGTTPAEPATQLQGLKLLELLDKFFLLKSHLTQATVISYKNTIQEFSIFLKNPVIHHIGISDVTRFQESISTKNSVRTVDNKIGTIRAIFNFAVKQGYFFSKNPAENRAILTKKQRSKNGWAMFEENEIQKIFNSEKFKSYKTSDPDFYYSVLLGLITGARIGEITSLTSSQFQKTYQDNNFIVIRDSKTEAGKREIPLPLFLFNEHFVNFINKESHIFKYIDREGKGTGNAVGKKFSRLLDELNIKRDKLVFHSVRKFTNDFCLKNDLSFEPRCQIFGHEIENVNVAIYSKKFTVDELSKLFNPIQMRLFQMVGILKTNF